jgi:hypothetical protein
MTSDKTDNGNKLYLEPTNIPTYMFYTYTSKNTPPFQYKDQAFNTI